MKKVTIEKFKRGTGLSNKEIATLLKVTPQTITNWTKGGIPLNRINDFRELYDSKCTDPFLIQTIKDKKGLTTKQIAKRLNIGETTVRTWERHGVPIRKSTRVSKLLSTRTIQRTKTPTTITTAADILTNPTKDQIKNFIGVIYDMTVVSRRTDNPTIKQINEVFNTFVSEIY